MIQLEKLTKKFGGYNTSKDYGSSRVMCLAAKDCGNENVYKCCYTFLSPQSGCFEACPTGWREITNDKVTNTFHDETNLDYPFEEVSTTSINNSFYCKSGFHSSNH